MRWQTSFHDFLAPSLCMCYEEPSYFFLFQQKYQLLVYKKIIISVRSACEMCYRLYIDCFTAAKYDVYCVRALVMCRDELMAETSSGMLYTIQSQLASGWYHSSSCTAWP